MRNCITIMLIAWVRFRRGRPVIVSWSGAWRSQEWPPVPHIGLLVGDTVVHYDSEDKNLSLVRMLNFNGRVKRLKYNRCNNYRPQPRGRKSAAAIRETEASLIA
jgi:hypothetical protein